MKDLSIFLNFLINNVEKVEDILKVGQKAQFRVIKVSKEEHKLGLSLKEKEAPAEEQPQRTREKETAPKQTAPAKEKPAKKQSAGKTKSEEQSGGGSRPKSMLQIELEKHAARQKTSDEETTDNENQEG